MQARDFMSAREKRKRKKMKHDFSFFFRNEFEVKDFADERERGYQHNCCNFVHPLSIYLIVYLDCLFNIFYVFSITTQCSVRIGDRWEKRKKNMYLRKLLKYLLLTITLLAFFFLLSSTDSVAWRRVNIVSCAHQ